MDKPKLSIKDDPEARIQQAIIDFMTLRGWWCKSSHGNAYTAGWPDLFTCHHSFGQRWVEVKLPDMQGSKFTPAQVRDFPQFIANGSGVWILTGATQFEYDKLFQPPNWWQYLSVMK